ncbi:MAG: ParB N-terminal domain-containing protein [Eubacterium sp.]|nr:ParB N-terminal domain-containing protein [Eubacterium sp.]
MDDIDQIRMMEVDELHELRNHTFHVRNDEPMKKLTESVKAIGIMNPLLAFINEDGEPELISGHRRLTVAKKLGLSEVPVVILHISREDATLLMGDSNLCCRDRILPSERAMTYKAMLKSIRNKTERGDLSGSVDSCRDLLAERLGESSSGIWRMIRITELIPELLELVDLGKLKIQTAVVLSYLDSESQTAVFSVYQETGKLPSASEAKELRKMMEDDKLTVEGIRALLAEQKGIRKADEYKLVFHSQALYSILGKCSSVTEQVNRVLRGLLLLEKQEKEMEAEYAAEQKSKLERIQNLKGRDMVEGGGDTYDW